VIKSLNDGGGPLAFERHDRPTAHCDVQDTPQATTGQSTPKDGAHPADTHRFGLRVL
jgi:hypothetical protein